MSIRHSLLTILAQGPCYGYQLRSEFDRRTGSTWPINVGQIYNTLDRLVRDGLATKSVENPEGNDDSSQHTYYSITDSGRLESDLWLNSPVERYSASRDELAIKLAIAVTLPGVDAHTVIKHQRTATRGAVDALALGIEQQTDAHDASDFAEQLVTDSMHAHAEAELRWLDHVETSLMRAQSKGLVQSFPLTNTKPKRGRPPLAVPQGPTPHDDSA